MTIRYLTLPMENSALYYTDILMKNMYQNFSCYLIFLLCAVKILFCLSLVRILMLSWLHVLQIIIQQIVTLSKYGHDALDICHP